MIRGALFTAFVVLATPASAETTILKCLFDWMCDPNRTCVDADLDIRFRLDLETNGVEHIGGADPLSRTNLVIGDRALSIVEVTVSGGMNVTTFMVDTGDAVHSRNAVEGTTLTPGQFLGTCTLL